MYFNWSYYSLLHYLEPIFVLVSGSTMEPMKMDGIQHIWRLSALKMLLMNAGCHLDLVKCIGSVFTGF